MLRIPPPPVPEGEREDVSVYYGGENVSAYYGGENVSVYYGGGDVSVYYGGEDVSVYYGGGGGEFFFCIREKENILGRL